MSKSFEEMSEEERHEDLLARESQFLSENHQAAEALRHQRAKFHLRYGLGLRAIMMERCRHLIRDESFKEREGPISHYTATDIAIHLNSFYVNLRGALDNLAWALAFEFQLLPNISEADDASRRFCELFRKDFRRAVEVRIAGTETLLDAFEEWYWDLKKFRDPAAHRLPLVVSRGVLNEESKPRYDAIMQEAEERLRAYDWNGWRELHHRAESEMKFMPIMISEEDGGQQIRIVPNQVAYDHSQFLDLCLPLLRSAQGAVAA